MSTLDQAEDIGIWQDLLLNSELNIEHKNMTKSGHINTQLSLK